MSIIGRLLDPRGPIGNIQSESIFHDKRLSVPVTAPHRAPALTKSEHNQPGVICRFVEYGAETPPKERSRALTPDIEERWAPVYGKTNSTDIMEILRVSSQQIGWNVSYHERNEHCDCTKATFNENNIHETCGRAHAPVSNEDFVQQIQSLNYAPADQIYNRFYPTIKGTDYIMTENGPAKGGHRITGGRSEYRRVTKDMVHRDSGFLAARKKAESDEKAAQKEKIREHATRVSKSLPKAFGQ